MVVNNITQEIPNTNTASQSIAPNSVPAVTAIIPPIITGSSPPINQSQSFSITGKGMPNALTKIQFQDVTDLSFGVRFVRFFDKGRISLSDVEIPNDSNGLFSYVSPSNLVAGVYNVVPSYVSLDNAKNVIGYGIKLFITDNILNRILMIIINALILVIPIMALILIIIFLPWYFKKELHVIGKKMELEEQKIDAEERNLAQDKAQRKRIQ